MRIGINGRILVPGRTGVGRYLENLLRIWARNPAHRFLVYHTDDPLEPTNRELLATGSLEDRPVPRPWGSYHLWHNVALPRALVRDHADFFFSPDYFAPMTLPRGLPFSLTVHDVSYLAHPEWFSWQYRIYCALNSTRPARRAPLLFTISEFQRTEIVRRLSVPQDRVVVTPLAADPRFRPGDGSPLDGSRLGITGPYFLYVGLIFNRRHIPETLTAFERMVQRTGHPTVQFLLRGLNQTRPHQDIDRQILEINTRLGRRAVVSLPYLPDPVLAALYQHAVAFLYPSTYEGFGLPILEALACGTPTVTVRATSIPEVAGEAAVYVDPTNTAGFANALERLLTGAAWRAELRTRSLAQAARFSWERTARATLSVLESVYARR